MTRHEYEKYAHKYYEMKKEELSKARNSRIFQASLCVLTLLGYLILSIKYHSRCHPAAFAYICPIVLSLLLIIVIFGTIWQCHFDHELLEIIRDVINDHELIFKKYTDKNEDCYLVGMIEGLDSRSIIVLGKLGEGGKLNE